MRSEVKCLCIGNLVFELHSHTGGIPSARVACFLRVDRLEIAIFLQLVQYRHCHMSGVMEMSSFAYIMWQTTQKQ